jgi:LPPG:FO 2-phospho-L-lactate transferase
VIVLSGGTGTPKLLQGLRRLIPDEEITIIVNTAEDIMISGGLVSPDVDTVLYLFSGSLDDKKWWGLRNDTFNTHQALKKMGINEKLMIGDIDRATHIMRSEMMRKGAGLTQTTSQIATAFRIKARVLPMCDEKVDTMIDTPQGLMHFQDFWIGAHGRPDVLGINIKGIENAKLTPEVMEALGSEENVIIGPSNPITSIGPILALKYLRGILSLKKVIAVSPIIGNASVSGPAGKLMLATGLPVSSIGVADFYEDILDIMVIDERDTADEKDFQVNAVRWDTMMTSVEKSEALARRMLGLFGDIG